MDYLNDIKTVVAQCLPWNLLQGKNILVTGATGLIGSTLIECLMLNPSIDYQVYASGRNKNRVNALFRRYVNDSHFHFLQYDVLDPLTSDIKFHYIISCAGLASPQLYSREPVGVMKSNFCGTDNLFSYGIKHGLEEFIYISSGEVYGEGDGRAFSEDYSGYVNCASLRACYPSAKRATESLCIAYGHQFGIRVKIVRPCHVFGPNYSDTDQRVYAQFLRNIIAGEDIVLKSMGQQLRSWCYSVDCASAILFIMMKGRNGEAYNVADPNCILTIRELAEIIAAIGKCRIRYELPVETEKNGYSIVTKSVFDTAKINNLGWKPLFSPYDALIHSIDHIKTTLNLH